MSASGAIFRVGRNDNAGEKDMDKKKAIGDIFLFTGVALAVVLIIGARHIGFQGVTDLLNPLVNLTKDRPMVLAAGIQPMVIWKKIQQSSLFQPNLPLSSPPAEAALDNENKPAAVVIEMATKTPATSPQERAIVATVAPAPIEQNETKAPSDKEIAVPANLPPPLPYSLQLCSCRAVESAQHSLADFKSEGLDVYLVKVRLAGDHGTWWRVYTGQYQTLDEALTAKKNLGLSDAIAKKTPFANLIGEYTSLDQTRTEQDRLMTLGFSPYVLTDPDNVFRLFVGAYTRKTQAERQAHELESMGLISQSVVR
jgi:cell division septation protein DedD